ncbi:hypothetical protein JOC85_003308 [Bacillus mesophilus]|uniref:Uncharacterized protein n=1 Tax=Bacillus mesophilus TaxID=1808955 RepID=A0A6M0Q948_9BACI|nr:hypothetical protein [Bacillus mesophilus]MBM7662501.1 hypothetical protein [Bacillus mesophilus]NEY72874.1 hypothetical protein [Bacillus mesophilus]
MELIKPVKEGIIAIPNIQIGNDIKQFFSFFLIQSILFILVTPIALSVPAYLFIHSAWATGWTAFFLFLLASIVFLTWLFISILFFYSVTEPKTWPRYVGLGWLVILIGTFTTWIIFLDSLSLLAS